MKVIKEIAVVVQSTSEGFHDGLMDAAQRFQGQELEVTINNPHLAGVVGNNPRYIAVVEGRGEEVNDNPPFAINRESTIPNRRI